MGRADTLPERWMRFRDTNVWVSDEGRIKHIYPNGRVTFLEGCRDKGTIKVKISTTRYTFQNVVWEAFNGPVPQGYVVIHKNGCITMNDLYNLEMITRSEHAKRLMQKNGWMVKDLQTGKTYTSLRECEKAVKKSRNTIREDCNTLNRRFRWVEGRGGRAKDDE